MCVHIHRRAPEHFISCLFLLCRTLAINKKEHIFIHYDKAGKVRLILQTLVSLNGLINELILSNLQEKAHNYYHEISIQHLKSSEKLLGPRPS